MNWIRGAIAVPFVMLLALLPFPAHATSTYDDIYYQVDDINIKHTGITVPCAETDITHTYERYILDDDTWLPGGMTSAMPNVARSYLAGKANGSVGITQMDTSSTTSSVYIYWVESGTISLNWLDNPGMIYTSPVNYLIIGCSGVYSGGSSNPSVTGFDLNESSYLTVSMRNRSTSVDSVYTSYFVGAGTPNLPSGYAGTAIRDSSPLAEYVAMGDSFSSGEGSPSFEADSDESGVNECHRSPDAYPRLLQFDAGLDLAPATFVACSGATTGDILNGGTGEGVWGEQKQIDALSTDTEVVTITVGGNDIGFSDFASACVLSSCAADTDIYDDTLGAIANVLPFALDDLYDQILEEAPNAEIYVMEYPYVVPDADPENYIACSLLDTDNPMEDMLAGHHVIDLLNGGIETAVDEANTRNSTTRMHLVSTTFTGSPFEGHDVCSADPWFNNTSLPLDYVFHPTADGQLAMAEIMEDFLTS